MAKSKVFVLGSSGMLGQQVSREFLSNFDSATVRCGRSGDVDIKFLFSGQSSEMIAKQLGLAQGDWLINCVGWIPQKAAGDSNDEKLAYELNVELPRKLNQLSASLGVKVLQVGTDCVFDGLRGGYVESSEMTEIDLYSRTKILGEKEQRLAMIVRSSIIGCDLNSSSGLFSWFLSQANQSSVSGYVDHRWNGVTTQALARVFRGIVQADEFKPGAWHLVPRDIVTKHQLLQIFQALLGAAVRVEAASSKDGPRDRTLSTEVPELSSRLWSLGGYSEAPSIRDMVGEMILEYKGASSR